MNIRTSYRHTLYASYMGYVTQAVVNNFVPLLLLTFQSTWGISLSRLATLVSVNFGIQLLVDLAGARFVDRIGYRPCIVTAHIMAGVGLICLGILPFCLPDPFVGILLSIMLYAIGGGLTEVLISPIVEACPTDHKDAAMSLLHSFYCWGAAATILISSLFFFLFGMNSWKWLAVMWALIPAINIYNFATCPIEHLVNDGNGMGVRQLFRTPVVWLAICLMICSGASELAMAQWASAYAEAALGLSKTFGDLIGSCMFAITMGISRLIFGKYGEKMDLMKFMTGSGILCVICYLLTTLSSNPVIGLTGCIVCGFSVGIMWPGTISITSKKMPAGGTAMFALLAMAGDLGGSIGPGIVGYVTQNSDNNIRVGMGIGLIFPLVLLIMLFILCKGKKTQESLHTV